MQNTWALIPFYWDVESPEYKNKVLALHKTISVIKKVVSKIAVVDDGGELDEDTIAADIFLKNQKNEGKAEAIRKGLKGIFEQDEDFSFIVQLDSDLDQDPAEAAKLLSLLGKKSPTGTEKILVIGDRYSGLSRKQLVYRIKINFLQDVIYSQLGYKLIDSVSGLRAYTRTLAMAFKERSKSTGFAIEPEQIILTYLDEGELYTIPLAYSRERDPYTKANKLLVMLEGQLIHKKELKAKGQARLIKLLEHLRNNISKREKIFPVDLKDFGYDQILNFRLLPQDVYTID